MESSIARVYIDKLIGGQKVKKVKMEKVYTRIKTNSIFNS